MEPETFRQAAKTVIEYYLGLQDAQRRVIQAILATLLASAAATLSYSATKASNTMARPAFTKVLRSIHAATIKAISPVFDDTPQCPGRGRLVTRMLFACADADYIRGLDEKMLACLRDRFGVVYVTNKEYDAARDAWRRLNPGQQAGRLFDLVFLPADECKIQAMLGNRAKTAPTLGGL